MRKSRSLIYAYTLASGCAAFSTLPTAQVAPSRVSALSAARINGGNESRICSNGLISTLTTRALASAAVSLAIVVSPLPNSPTANVAFADEWGKETEAPTLFTGETTLICKKRGPLGACVETTVRTVENDNDKALKYFKDPSEEVKRRQERMLQSANDDSEGNALITKLRQQSLDNKERNDNIVRQKTLLNDQGASFGPFNGQVVILNTDGRTFTLLQNPQAMRLKKAGYIEDRKFVIQPSQEVIDEALEGKNELGDAIKGFFGMGGSGGSSEEVDVKTQSADDVVNSVIGKENVAVGGDDVVESMEGVTLE